MSQVLIFIAQCAHTITMMYEAAVIGVCCVCKNEACSTCALIKLNSTKTNSARTKCWKWRWKIVPVGLICEHASKLCVNVIRWWPMCHFLPLKWTSTTRRRRLFIYSGWETFHIYYPFIACCVVSATAVQQESNSKAIAFWRLAWLLFQLFVIFNFGRSVSIIDCWWISHR